ncbi:MAG: mechanosensitive ion channel [Betaproteobacteria bacterium]|jgi:small-conductance mechanosensitive channel|nr:mechanosensitive ion channel [Betaproteobacteria bacterium]MBP6644345.1 mechanosensitive ion channel [Burkholderiaceae bacterium]
MSAATAKSPKLGWAAVEQVAADLQSPGVWVEIAALIFCVALAYGLTRWIASRVNVAQEEAVQEGESRLESVWFGRRLLDGLLFPTLALTLVYSAKRLLDAVNPQVAILDLAVPVFTSLALIRLVARVLANVFPSSQGARTLERGVSWLAWLATVLWILGFLPVILQELETIQFTLGKTKISLRMMLESGLSCVLMLVVTLWVSNVIEKRVLNVAVNDLSMRKVANNAVRAVLLLLGLLLAMSAVGIDLTALSVLGGAVGVGLAFGLQKLAANYVSGFVILLERSLRIGDMVKVDSFEGRITDIKTRYTLIRASNGRESVVPNEKMLTERVENLSLADPNIAVNTTIVVGYDSDVGQVQAILCAAAAGHARVLKDPAPNALLSSFAADGLEFTLVFWINDPVNGLQNVRSDIHIAMLQGLRAAGVDIPYPQRVIRMVS